VRIGRRILSPLASGGAAPAPPLAHFSNQKFSGVMERLTRRKKVGDRIGTMWIVEDGLKPGERVVAEGAQKVSPGAVVNPIPFK